MTINKEKLNELALLAYLDPKKVQHQLDNCNKIIAYIEHLQAIDTSKVSPLHHPTSVTQYLRPDEKMGAPQVKDLAQCATAFKNDLYIVPQIIKGL